MWSLFNRNKKALPEWLVHYSQLNFDIEQHTDLTFVVLDCETTGLSKSDSIITLGAVLCTANEIFMDSILDQKYPLSESGKSSEIHGELAHQSEVNVDGHLEELIEFVKNHVIVGHNISFDVGKINQLLQKKYGMKLKNKVLDTAQMAIRLDPIKFERAVGGQSNLGLDDLCKQYQIAIENRHTALGDAYLTAQLLQRLIYQLHQKGITRII